MGQILTTGITKARLGELLSAGFSESKPKALGVAVAYVSVAGFRYINGLVRAHRVRQTKLVADTRDGITHPMALASALDANWDVRVVDRLPGTFHPKLIVGGSAFGERSEIREPSLILAGSANLSSAALDRNGECSYLGVESDLSQSASQAWKECWDVGDRLTKKRLARYEQYFERRNRYRQPADLLVLGVADKLARTANGAPAVEVRPPPRTQTAISNLVATVAWAGLESFTGDYDLQVEFPRDAGIVLARILSKVGRGDSAPLLCQDGQVRQFIFRYYQSNGMWRLNVPNSTPDADWARQHKRGIAVVEFETESGGAHFQITRPGRKMQNVVDHSLALGTWGRTSTRLYGWY